MHNSYTAGTCNSVTPPKNTLSDSHNPLCRELLPWGLVVKQRSRPERVSFTAVFLHCTSETNKPKSDKKHKDLPQQGRDVCLTHSEVFTVSFRHKVGKEWEKRVFCLCQLECDVFPYDSIFSSLAVCGAHWMLMGLNTGRKRPVILFALAALIYSDTYSAARPNCVWWATWSTAGTQQRKFVSRQDAFPTSAKSSNVSDNIALSQKWNVVWPFYCLIRGSHLLGWSWQF